MTVEASPMMACRVCSGSARLAFRQPLLGRVAQYFDCDNCGYFQTETPYWLEQAYTTAINDVDTGIMQRNQLNLRRVVMTLFALGCMQGRVLDHAGGYGILVRLLRDAGIDARWDDKYCQNLLARGFEVGNAAGQAFDLLTAFEVMEHLVSPLEELRAMLQIAPSVLVSTELAPAAGPVSQDWWYLGPEHGQHIGFFRIGTLAWMADRLECFFNSDGRSVHLFSRSRIPSRWRPLQRAFPSAPILARLFLKSRTMTDFDALRSSRL